MSSDAARQVNGSVASLAPCITSELEHKRQKSRERKSLTKMLWEKLNDQKFCCALSGVRMTPDTAVLDHILPRSKGGSDDLDNLQWVTKQINDAKGTMTQDEFIGMCRSVAAKVARELVEDL